MVNKYCTAIEYPILSPREYLARAYCAGLSQKDAQEISGISLNTWNTWLYRGKDRKINAPYLERLHRVANDMGWL